MRILITGSTGLIGSELVRFLQNHGHDIWSLGRNPDSRPKTIPWDPLRGNLDVRSLEKFDGVVHLAGESIASRRWTPSQKERIRNSRILGTRLLSGALAGLSSPPAVLISASAIGYYGDRGKEFLAEDSPPGNGFLAEVCREWESATQAALDAGIRVVRLRIGMVLSRTGGALPRILTPFRLGLGGPLGHGRQYMSWALLEDLVGIIHYCLQAGSISGPVNAVAPEPVTNREFVRILGHILRRPSFFPAPAFMLRALMGNMADELLLASTRVIPGKLLSSDFKYICPDLESALKRELHH